MRKLIISDTEIDLPNDAVIALDFSINDIADVQMKSGIRSNKFKIPYTQSNIKALGWANNVSSSTLKPYRIQSGRLEQGGIQIIPNANCIIEDAGDGFNITIYDGNAKLFQALSDKTLADLDLSDLDHTWDIATVVASRLNTDGYIYPLVDWGNLAAGGNDIYTWQMMPCLFVHGLITRIFEEAGFTKSGSFLDSEFYRRLIIDMTFDNGLEYTEAERLEREFLVRMSTPVTGNIPLVWDGTHSVGTETVDPVPFDNEITDPANNFNTSTYQADITRAGDYVFNLNLNIELGAGSYPATTYLIDIIFVITASVYVNGVLYESTNLPYTFTTALINNMFPYNLSFATTEKYYSLGDVVKVVFTFDPSFRFRNGSTILTGAGSANYSIVSGEFSSVYSSGVKPGGVLSPVEYIGNMKQIDLLKSVANMCGIIFNTDQFTNDVEWHEFSEVKDNILNAKDWSQKIDAKSKPKIEYRLGRYAQKNFFKYTEDKDVVVKSTGELVIDDETLQPETTVVQLPFGATDMVTRLTDLKVPFIERYKTTISETGTPPVFGTWDVNQNRRILILDRQTLTELDTDDSIALLTDDSEGFTIEGTGSISGNVDYRDGVTTTNVTTDLPLAYFILPDKDYNLGFNDNLLETFYPALASVMEYPKVVTDIFKLSEKDIAELDYFTPVFLNINNENKNINGYFYINKIKGFRPDRMTQVTLIRI